MAYKLALLAGVLFGLIMMLTYAVFGQENAPYHYSRCPEPTRCCAVPAPMMTQPVPGGTPTVVPESFVALYGIHVTNENKVKPTPKPTPPEIEMPDERGKQAAAPQMGGHEEPEPGWDGVRYLQFFDTTDEPAHGERPIGSASWVIESERDRDMSVGDKRGWAFNRGIMACCSITQSTYTPSDECGFLIQWYR